MTFFLSNKNRKKIKRDDEDQFSAEKIAAGKKVIWMLRIREANFTNSTLVRRAEQKVEKSSEDDAAGAQQLQFGDGPSHVFQNSSRL